MASKPDHYRSEEERQHNVAFASQGISKRFRKQIDQTRNNDPTLTQFKLYQEDSGILDESWELLVRYISNSTHLTGLYLHSLTESKMSILSNKFIGSRSLAAFSLSFGRFGLSTVQGVIPCLKNCPNLAYLNFSSNSNITTDCFNAIVEAMDGSSVETLLFESCGITDITALADSILLCLRRISLRENKICKVPSLERFTSLEALILDRNEIGDEECRSIALLIANRLSALEALFLNNNNISDEGAEVLAISLKHNTVLKTLHMRGNAVTEDGLRVFLKILNDISSIERTYKSNHSLRLLSSNPHECDQMLKKHIDSALSINGRYTPLERRSHAAGRAKIIETTLNSTTRKELCHLQGIEYSYSAMFAAIDPVLLPNLLALASSAHGQDEIYSMLVATGADLFSLRF